ncbi:MAG: MATE family efflux transporter [Spirochaetaceae bacterium]|nr:MATE family efflux transporter [Myxococcales bacterium]MCB9723776.1 MATE family efflux transporter [Spirochaetaceae bacterium]
MSQSSSAPVDTPSPSAPVSSTRPAPSRRSELRALFELSAPISLTQLGYMVMGVIDTMMVARVGVEALAAVAIAGTWVWSSGSFVQGLIQGMDPLVSQAHGRGDDAGASLALHRGLVITLVVSLPLMALWASTEPILLALGQDPVVAGLAQTYLLARLPSAVGFLLFAALRQYLAARGVTRPAMWVMFAGNGVNVLLNWMLIFGHLGMAPLGVVGAGIATSITNTLLPLGLWLWMRAYHLPDGAWRRFDPRMLELAGFGRYLWLGFPVGVQLALEANAFTIAMLMVGWLGVASLAAHQVVINMASFTFMLPLGIAIGASARAGNLIGAGDAARLRMACRTALYMGGGVMSIAAIVFVTLRSWLPALYVDDAAVVTIAATLLPIAAGFQIADGVQVVGGGLMRGMGRPYAGAVVNLIGFYGLGLPLAHHLAFRSGLGIVGVWWGMAVALAGVAIMLCLWVARTARRPLEELCVDTR